LYQQVLYERLGTARRLHLHRRIGARLAAGYGARSWEIASQLAVHFEHGGETQQAVHAWQQAGEQALRRFAYAEAMGHLRRVLTLLEAWAEGPERWQQELAVQIQLGAAFLAARGYTAPETEQAFRRALVLSQQLGEHQQTFPAHHGLFQYYYAQGRHTTARAIAEQLRQLAHASTDPAYRVVAHRAMGMVLAAQGELREARWHVEQSLALYTPGEHEVLILHYGLDFQVFDLSLLALVLWLLGFPDQAWQRNVEAIRVARALDHPFSQGQALNFAVMVQQCSGDVPQTRTLAEALIAVATEHGFPLWLAAGQVLRGWTLAAQGQDDSATHLQQGIATYQAMGLRFALPYGLALLAPLYGRTGQPEAGLATLAEAFDMVETQGEYMWQAELFRLKGELLLGPAVAVPGEAECCFQQALAIARAQHARAWELRAATSLARLWQQQGKRHEAHQVLAKVYGWFTEGFATADLQAAQALLQELI
jgi:predicted ATPase